jgi:hypothetical protein
VAAAWVRVAIAWVPVGWRWWHERIERW